MKTAIKKAPSKTVEDLLVWQKSRVLTLYIYKLTKTFPDDEKFGLISQMRRAAISVSSNIAEGFARRQEKDKERFYTIANGSLSELTSQLIVSRDLSYISGLEINAAKELVTETRKSLLAMLRAHRG